MTFKAFYQMMILLFWLIMLIGGTAGATVWFRERFADRPAKRGNDLVGRSPDWPESKNQMSRLSISSTLIVGRRRNSVPK